MVHFPIRCLASPMPAEVPSCALLRIFRASPSTRVWGTPKSEPSAGLRGQKQPWTTPSASPPGTPRRWTAASSAPGRSGKRSKPAGTAGPQAPQVRRGFFIPRKARSIPIYNSARERPAEERKSLPVTSTHCPEVVADPTGSGPLAEKDKVPSWKKSKPLTRPGEGRMMFCGRRKR